LDSVLHVVMSTPTLIWPSHYRQLADVSCLSPPQKLLRHQNAIVRSQRSKQDSMENGSSGDLLPQNHYYKVSFYMLLKFFVMQSCEHHLELFQY
jgi:hypothetical protein